MSFAAALAVKLDPQNTELQELAARQDALLEALKIPTKAPEFTHDEMLSVMMHDKKTENGTLHFVLPDILGTCRMKNVQGIESYI